MPKPSAINLLPKSEFESSFWGRFLKWSLSLGRYIIILTEIVVIIAFLSRFKLDKDLLDLNDSIAGKKNILEATYQIEQNFRSAQSRINQAKEILSITPSATQLLDKMTTNTPVGLSLQSIDITFTARTIALNATASAELQLGQYLAALATDKSWKGVEVSDIQSTNGVVKFGLNLGF